MKFLKPLWASFLFVLVCVFVSCVSSPIDEFKSVRPGMDKSDVLEAVGSPVETKNFSGMTIWKYRFTDDKGGDRRKMIKEIHFKDNQVTYVGEPITFSESSEKFKVRSAPGGMSEVNGKGDDFIPVED